MHEITTAFIDAIKATPSAPPIIAIFKNREPVTYTAASLELLKTDPAVMDICDGETGEIIFTRG